MKKVALLQISDSMGGSEIRMFKVAVALARSGQIRPVLLTNAALARSYRMRPSIQALLRDEDIELRIVDERKLRRVQRAMRMKAAVSGRFPGLRRMLGSFLIFVSPASCLIAPMVRDVDVIHGFFGEVSLAAILSMPKGSPQICIHEVTSHRIVPRYARIVAEDSRTNGVRVMLNCVSSTVLDDLEKALTQKGMPPPQSRISLSTNPGPFVGTIRSSQDSEKQRRLVFGHRLQPAKNGLVFAQAVYKAFEAGLLPEWTVSIFGRGPQETKIRGLLEDHVRTGRVTIGWSEDLESELSGSAIFVSIIETGNYPSQSVFEALGNGNIVCLSDTGVTREKFGDVPGVTFYCDPNPDSVLKAISRAVDHVESKGLPFTRAAAGEHFEKLRKQSGYLDWLIQIYGTRRQMTRKQER